MLDNYNANFPEDIMKKMIWLSAVVMLFVAFVSAPLFGQSTPYFQGKTILLVQGREPGGTGALRPRPQYRSKEISSRRADHRHPIHAGRRRP